MTNFVSKFVRWLTSLVKWSFSESFLKFARLVNRRGWQKNWSILVNWLNRNSKVSQHFRVFFFFFLTFLLSSQTSRCFPDSCLQRQKLWFYSRKIKMSFFKISNSSQILTKFKNRHLVLIMYLQSKNLWNRLIITEVWIKWEFN